MHRWGGEYRTKDDTSFPLCKYTCVHFQILGVEARAEVDKYYDWEREPRLVDIYGWECLLCTCANLLHCFYHLHYHRPVVLTLQQNR